MFKDRTTHGDPFTPRSIREEGDGLRPSYEKLLALIDTTDPAWPATSAILCEMTDAGVELDAAVITAAIKLGRQRLDSAAKCSPARTLLPAADNASARAIVYYIRRGDLVKIGTTVNPAQRFRDLLPDEIYATEPGGRNEERARHRQFRHLRCQGEHFRMAPELLAHIKRTRKKYGRPNPAWPTSATAATKGLGAVPPSPPVTGETMSAKEALDQLGIPYTTLRVWVNRGILHRVGRQGVTHFYYADQLRELAGRCRRPAGV